MKEPIKTTMAWLTDALRVDHEYGYPMDLDPDIHDGFTIGGGKVMFWLYTISPNGNFTCYAKDESHAMRWIDGDQEITVHYMEK